MRRLQAAIQDSLASVVRSYIQQHAHPARANILFFYTSAETSRPRAAAMKFCTCAGLVSSHSDTSPSITSSLIAH